MSELTEIETSVLKLANSYGVDLDLSGPRVSRDVKAAVRELLRKGHLTGTIKGLSLTVRGSSEITNGERDAN
jgi:hypothetical protein